MDDPQTVSRYLGCEHRFSEQKCPLTQKTVRVIEWDMGEFMQSCVDAYEKLANWKCTRIAATSVLPQEEEPPPTKSFYVAVANQINTHFENNNENTAA